MFFNSKGQYLSAEQMLLFSLGVVITISIYFSFSTINQTVEKEVVDDSMERIGNEVASGISRVYTLAGEGKEVERVNLSLDVPKTISEEGYKIKTQESKVLVDRGSEKEVVDVGNLSDVSLSGEVYSGRGELKVVFEKSTNTIKITRERQNITG